MTSASPWVEGPNKPLEQENETYSLKVEGAIPPSLCGSLLRNGPNPIGPVDEKYQWFGGDGMVHQLQLNNGKATLYRNRWVRTAAASSKLKEKCGDTLWPSIDPANTNIYPMAGGVYALTETAQPYKLNEKLETVGRDDFSGAIKGGFTAHPHRDPTNGDIHAVGYDATTKPEIIQYVFDKSGKLKQRFSIETSGPVSAHDFGMTDSHWLYYDLGLTLDQKRIDEGWALPYGWDDDYDSRVGILARDDKDCRVRWFSVPNCWVFHTLNAYDEIGDSGEVERIVCDVVRFEAAFKHNITGPKDPYPPQLYRWTFNLRTGAFSEHCVDERVQEFPRIDERFWGKKHNFGVTTELFSRTGSSGLLVFDNQGSISEYDFGLGNSASEFIFVPDSEESNEGEGWLLGMVWEGKRDLSSAYIFDATSVGSGPVATIELPNRVPGGFHGDWFPGL